MSKALACFVEPDLITVFLVVVFCFAAVGFAIGYLTGVRARQRAQIPPEDGCLTCWKDPGQPESGDRRGRARH